MGRPCNALRTLIFVPGFHRSGARYSACLPSATHDQVPGCGGSVFTNSRRWTSARASFGIGGSNPSTTGIAVPYV